jgi:hypothetical protein
VTKHEPGRRGIVLKGVAIANGDANVKRSTTIPGIGDRLPDAARRLSLSAALRPPGKPVQTIPAVLMTV